MSDDASPVAWVRRRIERAAERAGRDPAGVLLLGASKTVAPAEVLGAVRAGLTCVGENKVQELLAKQDALSTEADARGLRWDLIGTLQRNKINRAVGRVALIHSVDSVALAEAIGARARALGAEQAVLLEVNTSGEPSKHGFAPDQAAPAGASVAAVPGLRLRGLMTLAAPGNLDASRACFRRLAAIRRDPAWPPDADELSMGMSDDFEVAVEEGATIVRVGTALFGARCDAGLGA